jgi:hypothetical protein
LNQKKFVIKIIVLAPEKLSVDKCSYNEISLVGYELIYFQNEPKLKLKQKANVDDSVILTASGTKIFKNFK